MVIAAVLIAWEFLPRLGVIDSLALAPFSEAVPEAVNLLISGEAVPDLLWTLTTILIAFGAASVLGLAIGYVLWRWQGLFRAVNPYLTSYYGLPIIVFYPVLIVIFGLSGVPVIVLATSWAIVAIILSTATGLTEVPQIYHKVAAVYRLSTWQAMRRIYMPAAAPHIFNGLRLGASYAIVGVIGTEFLLAPQRGLGYLAKSFYQSFEVAPMYGALILVIVISSVGTSVLKMAERRAVSRWQ
jgi:NitT/TauT family transport system permease protein